MTLLAIAIKARFPGGVVHLTPRRPRRAAIKMYKFRSMVADAGEQKNPLRELNGQTGHCSRSERSAPDAHRPPDSSPQSRRIAWCTMSFGADELGWGRGAAAPKKSSTTNRGIISGWRWSGDDRVVAGERPLGLVVRRAVPAGYLLHRELDAGAGRAHPAARRSRI